MVSIINVFTILKLSFIHFIILYSVSIILCAVRFFWIQMLEKYWNLACEDVFCKKVHEIILEINPRIVVFSNRNLLYKMNYIIQKSMTLNEKLLFEKTIHENGLEPRLRKYIDSF